MAVSYKAPINPKVLRWARESLAIDLERAAKAAVVPPERYKKWELGEELPTISKLRKLANLYKRPLPVFFMPQVPKEPPIPKDFRTFHPNEDSYLTTESKLAIRKAMWYQSVARDLMNEMGYSIKSIKKDAIDINEPIEETVERLRKMELETQLSWKDNWTALKNWRQYVENEGIFVFQIAMPKDEIRGFSLIRENYPPAIVINSKDSPNGRIFTLFHEYAHFLLNKGGICIPEEVEFRDKKVNETEKYCNEFAGTFLVPTEYLNKLITEFPYSDIFELIDYLSKEFTISRFVILRRLYSIQKIDYNSYQEIYHKLRKQVKEPAGSGGDFYRNKIIERGKKLVSLVVEAESGKAITTSRALEILDIKLKHYNRIIGMLYE